MIICGIKLTHDGAIALIDNGRLIFSYEIEKLDNRPRYSPFSITLEEVEDILNDNGYSMSDIDQIVIDGWDTWDAANINNKEVKVPELLNIASKDGPGMIVREIAEYGRLVQKGENVLAAKSFTSENVEMPYNSYQHVAGHILASYCTSPFSKKEENSFVMVWDGGMPPQLFYYQPKENELRSLGHLFPIMGYIYINFPHAFKPFNELPSTSSPEMGLRAMSIAGKAMAYIALGEVDPRVMAEYKRVFTELESMIEGVELNIDLIAIVTAEFIKRARAFCDEHGIEETNMLTTFHFFFQDLFVEKLREKVAQYPDLDKNLCFAGGCALNIKWNSHIRDSGIFNEMWIPPFPNDAGSAIGTACCEMVSTQSIKSLDWTVYSGPKIKDLPLENDEFESHPCSLKELAYILHTQNEPVIFLNGNAEIGPRALGNRSILAPAADPNMKSVLNRVKGREGYRPVAPLCLEEYAAEVFTPGSPDPYMLYEHRVREEWLDKVPTITHLDGTARLQTINEKENAVVYELLTHYRNLSGIPLLCNTSANLNGSGFFPDVRTVMKWGRVNFIYNDGKIYSRKGTLNKEVFNQREKVDSLS